MFAVASTGSGLVAVGADRSGGDADAAIWNSPDGITWSRVPHDEAALGGESDQFVNDVTVGGPGLVAVGHEGPLFADTDAAVWTSPDGITWSRAPHDEAVFGGENDQSMTSITAGGPGLVAVGRDSSGDDSDAAVWTSADGITWSRVPHGEAVFGGENDQGMNSVTAGGLGLVAVGGDGSAEDEDAAAWISPNGITWSRVPHDEAVFGGDSHQYMSDVRAGGPGLVAVGRDFDDTSGARVAAVWTSPDGRAWSRVPHSDAAFAEAEMNSVTASGMNLVVVGVDRSVRGWDGAVWISPDGINWSRVPHDGGMFGGDDFQRMHDVTATEVGFVAVGHDNANGEANAAVWAAAPPSIAPPPTTPPTTTSTTTTTTSPVPLPSTTWSRAPHRDRVFGGEGLQQMFGVAVGGPGLVAVGTDDSSDGFFDAAVWTSPDGITWSRVPHDEAVFGEASDPLSHQQMIGIIAGGPGLVAVGLEFKDDDLDAAVWTSPDGIAWSRVPDDDTALGGAGGQSMLSVTVGGPGLVAVGSEASAVNGFSDAAVWTSVDGITWTRVPDDDAVFGDTGDELSHQWMLAVTAGGPGLVAVGEELAGDFDAAVWTSVDGITWSRIPNNNGVFGGESVQEMFAVTAGGPGLVAVGTDLAGDGGGFDAAVWTSVDGITWSRIPDDGGAFGGDGHESMVSVTIGGPGFVAVGVDESAEELDKDAAVWISADGVTWSRVPHDEAVFGGEDDQQMVTVIVGGPGLVAVGGDGPFDDADAAVWLE